MDYGPVFAKKLRRKAVRVNIKKLLNLATFQNVRDLPESVQSHRQLKQAENHEQHHSP